MSLKYSIGETIDKLAVVHLKIWHLEEEAQKGKKENWSNEKLEVIFDKIINLNKYRMKIVDAINEFFEK